MAGPTLTPDAALADYQWEIEGLVLGPGTAYSVRDWKGLESPGVRATDSPRPNDHGAFFGRDTLDKRVIELADVLVLTPTDLATDGMDYRDALVWAWRVRAGETVPLRFCRPTWGTRRVYGRPRRISVTEPKGIVYGIYEAALQFECPDPLMLSDELHTASSTPSQVNVGTLVFPITFPITFGGGGASGLITATNAGNWASKPTAVISGPCTNPRIIGPTGLVVSLLITLGSADTLVIDFDARSIVQNGTASRRDVLASYSAWWDLPPGTSEVSFFADSVDGQLTLSWRDAWI